MFRKEFDRQVENLLQKGYPDIVGIRPEEFFTYLEPLKAKLGELASLPKVSDEDHIPFVIVLKNDLALAEKAMQAVTLNGKPGFSVMEAEDINRFQPIASVPLPCGAAYLVAEIDTGKGTLNITPEAALKIIQQENRSPLTIEEGIALITHYPASLKKNHCFSLPGSRCGDRRVAALWISAGRPKLGWCWAGNPHTWLGSASCGSHLG